MPYAYHRPNRAGGWLTLCRGYISVYNMLRDAWTYDSLKSLAGPLVIATGWFVS